MDLGLTDKRALITGGSHGLGRAIALSLAREGVFPAICGRNGESLEAAARTIEDATGVAVVTVVADVMELSALEHLADVVTERLGGIDILVNNADVLSHQSSDFFNVTDEDWTEKFNIKLLAPIRLTRLLAPGMVERGWGRIVNIGGAATRRLLDTEFAKGAAQAALVNMSKKLSNQLGPHGVTVNVVEPGGMWTDGKTVEGRSRAETRREAIEVAAAAAGVTFEEKNAEEVAKLVLGRRIEVEDGAVIVTFLVSALAGTITGEVLLADGGESRYVRF